MKRLIASLILAASPVWADDLPSGQSVTLQEVLIDEVGTEVWLRFRFVAPAISRAGGTVDYDTAAEDMQVLCDRTALPYMTEYALTGDVIVISLADRETEFGQADPDATQFFEAFRPVDNACIWEVL